MCHRLPFADSTIRAIRCAEDSANDDRSCRVLLIYPHFVPNSFWNYADACKLVDARYPAAPLGLITVAAMLPQDWEFKLVNCNTEELDEADIDWADMVMTGGMLNQQPDCLRLIDLCHAHGKPVVVGGPDVTSSPHLYADGGLPGAGRGRGRHRGLRRRLGARRALRRIHRREIPDRRHQDADAALRPAEVRPLSLYRRAVFARLSVHLRVLRHHRALRPRAAHQDERADAGRTRSRSTRSAIAATSISSTTT